MNASIIILMGIPGGIDYLLLTLVKLKLLHPKVEKDKNQLLNVWLRCPVAVITAFISIVGAYLHPQHFTGMPHRCLHALVGLHHYWNGCFFMYRTVDARTRFAIKQKELKEAEKKA